MGFEIPDTTGQTEEQEAREGRRGGGEQKEPRSATGGRYVRRTSEAGTQGQGED